MAKRSGVNLQVYLTGTDVSANQRSYEIDENPGEQEKIDVTARGATARVEINSFDGAPNTTVSMNVLSDNTTDPIAALVLGTSYTFAGYPDGKTHTYQMDSLAGAVLNQRVRKVPFDGVVEWDLTFNSTAAVSYTTYSSAA